MPEYNDTIANWKSDSATVEQLSPKSSPLLLYKGPEHIVKGDIAEMGEAFKHLEDGRMYFAVDTKKIYVDCKFTTSDGDLIEDRLSFGGNNGIFYGRKIFTDVQIENKEYWFIYEEGDLEDNRDDIPQVDDLILNVDGCFYRVTDVHMDYLESEVTDDQGNVEIVQSDELYTIIECKKLTIAGSGTGGGGGGTSSVITVARSPEQPTTFVKARNTIPIIFRVTDSIESVTNIDIDIYINSQYVGSKSVRVSSEYQTLDLKQYAAYFTTNSSSNQVRLAFKDEYDSTAGLTLRNLNLVDLAIVLESANLGQKTTTSFPIKFYPYGGSSMYSWKVKIRLNPPGQGNAILDEMTTTADRGAEETYTVSNLGVYGEGSYTIDFWIEALAEEGADTTLVSPTVSASFYYADENSTTPGVTMSVQNSDNLSQYSTATILYTVVYAGSSKSTVHLRAICDGVDVVNTYSTVNNGINQTWLVPLDLAGTYQFIIGLDDYNYSTSVDEVPVSAPDAEVPTINKENNALQLYLSATGKSNSQTDRDQWTWKNITSTFDHFNWNTDGWQTDDKNQTSLHLSNGAKLTVNFAPFSQANTGGQGAQYTGKTLEFDFKLSNVRDVSKILMNIASWDAETGAIYSGIVCQGDKISINTTDLTNYRTAEEDLELDPDVKAKTNGLRAYLAEDERIHVAFVVQSASEDANKSLIYTYINGVLSGLADYKGSLIDNDRNNPAYMVFDSTYGDIDLYNIRVYSKKFTDDEILYNYAADRPTVEERLAVQANNAALDNNNEISLTEVMALGNIPYIVWTDCRKTSDKKGKKGIQDQSPSLPTGKKDFRWCEFYYVDPEHPDRNIGDINHKVLGVIYAQGTSSLDYPVKNIRLRIRETDANGNDQSKYSLLPAIPIEGLNSSDPTVKANAEAEQAKWEKVPAVRLFTFKTDYMDSSLAHNTGTGNVLAALYDSVNLKTPAQEYYSDSTITSNIVGRPCLGFYQAYNTTTPVFVGRYNFNTDKAEQSLFGFEEEVTVDEASGEVDTSKTFGVATYKDGDVTKLKWGFHGTLDEEYDAEKVYYNSPSLDSNNIPNDIWMQGASAEDREAAFKLRVGYKDSNGETVNGTGPALYEYQQGPSTIQCWEFLNNGSALCFFRNTYVEGTDEVKNWTGAFESRYPEYMTEPATDKRGFLRLINWLRSTDQLAATDEDLTTPETYGGVTYTTDSKARRLAKFKAELSTYMNVDMTVFYYVVTEALVMIDSRAKNMMMCSYDVDMDAGTGHWFPIFYDMDTILGVDNKGILRFAYDTDDETDTRAFNAAANYGHYENGEWVNNGRASVLWANLREGFQTEISSMYNALRDAGKFTYKFLSQSYNDSQADAFAAIYDNKDAKYKYIDPYGSKVIKNGVESDVDANYLHAAQGTRTLHREYFMNHRFTLLDSKYPKISGGDYLSDRADIVLRLYDTSTGANKHPTISPSSEYYGRLQLTSQSTQYGVYKVANGASLPPVKLEPGTPTWTPALPDGFTANDQETYLFSLGDIYDLGDLSDKFPSTFDIRAKTKLRTLNFGLSDEGYVSSTVLNISGWNNLPLLELLNIRKKHMQANPNLVNCSYFQTLLAAGSDITSVTLPVGGNLKKLELPATMQQLIIRDHRFYDTKTDATALTCEGYSRLVDLWIEGCPLVDTAGLLKSIMTARNGAALTHVRLPDIDWDIDATTDWCSLSNGVINDIPIVEFLSRASYGWDAEGNLTTANTYIAGTIRIHNGTDEDEDSVGVDIYTLNKKYNAIFPELKFEYDENSKNITGYYINIHDLAGGKIVENNGYINSTVIGIDEVLGTNDTERFNYKQHLERRVAIPTRNPDGQYTYEFKGWSISKDGATVTQGFADPDEDLVDARCDIKVTVVEATENDDAYMETDLESPYLTVEDFDSNLELNLYPVFLKHLRVFNVWFYMTEEGAAEPVLNPEYHTVTDAEHGVYIEALNAYYTPHEVVYGTDAGAPSNEPTIITLDANDKTSAMMRKMLYYDEKNGQIPLNRVTTNCSYYPVFDVAQRMSEITSPPTSYFTVEALTNTTVQTPLGLTPGANACCATIKASFTGEAIVVPLVIDGMKVVTLKNLSSTVKRIFFEKDADTNSSNILYFLGGLDSGFNKVNDVYLPETTTQENSVLEYVEFKACKELLVIGGGQDGTNLADGCEFANCPNLYVDELPDSVMWIGDSAFRKDPEVRLTKLPNSLVFIGQYAFRRCTGLGTIDMSDYNPDSDYNTQIGYGAFENCTNLNFGTEYYFQGWKVIGDYAFHGCTSLKAFDRSSPPDGTTITTVGVYAFDGCRNLNLISLPASLASIGTRGFSLGGGTTSNPVSIGLSELKATLKYIGDSAFGGCTIVNENGNGIAWRLDANENPSVDVRAFNTLICQRIRFADWSSADAVYADFDDERPEGEKWRLAHVAPWWSDDEEQYLVPFGATVAVNGASTPYTIDINNG